MQWNAGLNSQYISQYKPNSEHCPLHAWHLQLHVDQKTQDKRAAIAPLIGFIVLIQGIYTHNMQVSFFPVENWMI